NRAWPPSTGTTPAPSTPASTSRPFRRWVRRWSPIWLAGCADGCRSDTRWEQPAKPAALQDDRDLCGRRCVAAAAAAHDAVDHHHAHTGNVAERDTLQQTFAGRM